MNKSRLAVALLSAGLVLSVSQAQACGESMFKSGQAMRYHSFISRQPAQIMIYRPIAEGPVPQQIYSSLEKAGHKVTVVTDARDLTQALSAKRYDVIIASTSDMEAVATHLDASRRAPSLLAVTGSGAARDARFPLCESDGPNAYLKIIEETMHARGS